jgi:hypothetical protein
VMGGAAIVPAAAEGEQAVRDLVGELAEGVRGGHPATVEA